MPDGNSTGLPSANPFCFRAWHYILIITTRTALILCNAAFKYMLLICIDKPHTLVQNKAIKLINRTFTCKKKYARNSTSTTGGALTVGGHRVWCYLKAHIRISELSIKFNILCSTTTPHFKLLAAIAVAPQSMLSHCFAIPHTLKVRGGLRKNLCISKKSPF